MDYDVGIAGKRRIILPPSLIFDARPRLRLMDYDVGIVKRKRFISPASSFFHMPPAAPPSGFAFIDSVEATGGQASPAITAAMDSTGADLLVAVVSQWAGATDTTVTDNKSNNWTGGALTGRGSNTGRTRIWWCKPTSVGSGHTFTSNNAADIYGTIIGMAFSGAHASPFDVENGNGADIAVTSTQPGSVTPSQANSLIIAACSPADQSLFPYGIDSGFTEADEVEGVTSTIEGLIAAYLIQGAAAAVNPTFSWTVATNPGAAIAVFKPA